MSRKKLYYESVQESKDLLLKATIEELFKEHPAYGHKRLALLTGRSKNTILRVQRKYELFPPRRKAKKRFLTRSGTGCQFTNLIRDIKPARPYQIICSDITYIKYQGKFVYLATLLDLYTREILSAELSDHHDSDLILQSLQNLDESILEQLDIFHSDQGTEFMAQQTVAYLSASNINISVSDKGSPWQNGYMESFFDKFKVEVGDLNRFEDPGEFFEAVYQQIYYYNNRRMHSSIHNTCPVKFRIAYYDSNYAIDNLSQNSGT